MPFVEVLYKRLMYPELGEFVIALQEVVPAALHSKQGPLTPGCLDISGKCVESPFHINSQFLITIIARDCEDRRVNLEEREGEMEAALAELFPEFSFAIRLELKDMLWVYTGPKKPKSRDCDMSMEAAMRRAPVAIDCIPG